MEHEMKLWPEFYDDVVDGVKRAEFRDDDRVPKVMAGDTLRLVEYRPVTGEFTGRAVRVLVTQALRGGEHMPPGKVLLSIADPRELSHRDADEPGRSG